MSLLLCDVINAYPDSISDEVQLVQWVHPDVQTRQSLEVEEGGWIQLSEM